MFDALSSNKWDSQYELVAYTLAKFT